MLNNLAGFVLNRLESAEGINTTHTEDLEKEIQEEDVITNHITRGIETVYSNSLQLFHFKLHV